MLKFAYLYVAAKRQGLFIWKVQRRRCNILFLSATTNEFTCETINLVGPVPRRVMRQVEFRVSRSVP